LKSIADKYAGQFPQIKLFTITEIFGGWQNAQKKHFSDGGMFDQIYQPGS
jgi:sulfate transport system substrate-binding protein